jgi:hypothetical protein
MRSLFQIYFIDKNVKNKKRKEREVPYAETAIGGRMEPDHRL